MTATGTPVVVMSPNAGAGMVVVLVVLDVAVVDGGVVVGEVDVLEDAVEVGRSVDSVVSPLPVHAALRSDITSTIAVARPLYTEDF